jgi:hypothetical protein
MDPNPPDLAPRSDEADARPPARADRRQFLRRAGIGGAVVAAAAIPLTPLTAVMVAQAETEALEGDDLSMTQLLASLDLAAAALYQQAIAKNLLDPGHTEAASSFGSHHADHAKRLNTALGSKAEVAEPNARLVSEFEARIAGVGDAKGLQALLFDLEQGLAATYQLSLEIFETKTAAANAASIQPVESQHAVVWGQSQDLPIATYVPGFQDTDDAFIPAQYAG